ncbi:MAG: peptidoglycan-binding protein [Vulcanimicrobiota bacterium]
MQVTSQAAAAVNHTPATLAPRPKKKPSAKSDRVAFSDESRSREKSTSGLDLSWANQPAENKKRQLDLPHRNLKQGDQDETRVRRLQQLLNQRAEAGLEVDGKFGPRTERAVAEFQHENGIRPNGQVGSRTLDRLNRGLSPEHRLDLPEAALRTGMKDKPGLGEHVANLQQMLNDFGGSKLKVDGAFGRNTEAAVKAFQTKQGLEPNGRVEGATRDALNGLANPLPGDKQGWGSAVKAQGPDGQKPAPIAQPQDLSRLPMADRLRILKQGEQALPLTRDLKKRLPGAIKTLEKLAGEDRVWDTRDRANNLVQLRGAIEKGAHREIDRRFDQEVGRQADQSWVSRNLPLLKPVVRGLYGLGAESQREGAHKQYGDEAVRTGQQRALFDLNDGFRQMGMQPSQTLDPASRRRALGQRLPQVSEKEMTELKDVLTGLQKQSGQLGLPKGTFAKGLSVDFLKAIQQEKPLGLVGVAGQEPGLYQAASKALPLNSGERQEVKTALGTLRKLAGKDGVWDRGDVGNNVRQLDGELRQEVSKRIDQEFDQRFDGEFDKRFGKEFDKRFRAEASKRIRSEIDRRIENSPLLGLLAAFPGGRGLMESQGWAEAEKQRPGIYAKERQAAREKYYPIEKEKAHRDYTASGLEQARAIAGREFGSGLDRLGVDGSAAPQAWDDNLTPVTQAELAQLRRTLTMLGTRLDAGGFGSQGAHFTKGLPTEFLEHIYAGKPVGLLGILTR